MEEAKPSGNENLNQGLLDALESLSAALSVVSSSVDMVREELQQVLEMLTQPGSEGKEQESPSQCHPVLPFELPQPQPVRCETEELPAAQAEEAAPPIYLIEGAARQEREQWHEVGARKVAPVGV